MPLITAKHFETPFGDKISRVDTACFTERFDGLGVYPSAQQVGGPVWQKSFLLAKLTCLCRSLT